MTWAYFNQKTWAEVTRDERFFCQHLYQLIKADPTKFVEYVNAASSLGLQVSAKWEVGYEVCFYRDLWFLNGKTGPLHSQKRTFDLCLFSTQQIVIIEAKAQQGFDSDPGQKVSFLEDKTAVFDLTKSHDVKEVLLLGLASSKYLTNEKKSALLNSDQPLQLFDGLITWSDLARDYADDQALLRADAIYDGYSGGVRNQKHMTITEILATAEDGKPIYVGCEGGMAKFLSNHRHTENRKFETSSELVSNKNWFLWGDVCNVPV